MSSDTIILSYDGSTLKVDEPLLKVHEQETIYWETGSDVSSISGVSIVGWPSTFGLPTTVEGTTSWLVTDYDTESETTTYKYTISGYVTNVGYRTLDPQIEDDAAD